MPHESTLLVTDRRLGKEGIRSPACLSSAAGWVHARRVPPPREGVSPPTTPPSFPQNRRSVHGRSCGPQRRQESPETGARRPPDHLLRRRSRRNRRLRISPAEWVPPAHNGRRNSAAPPDVTGPCARQKKRHRGAVRGRSISSKLVPRIGFEPMISALRGPCPRPLDERGIEATGGDRPGGMIARPRPSAPTRIARLHHRLSPVYIRCDSRNALTPSATCWKLDSPMTRP